MHIHLWALKWLKFQMNLRSLVRSPMTLSHSYSVSHFLCITSSRQWSFDNFQILHFDCPSYSLATTRGLPCHSDHVCGSGLVCGVSSTCEPVAEQGDVCYHHHVCQAGLVCGPGSVCVQLDAGKWIVTDEGNIHLRLFIGRLSNALVDRL